MNEGNPEISQALPTLGSPAGMLDSYYDFKYMKPMMLIFMSRQLN